MKKYFRIMGVMLLAAVLMTGLIPAGTFGIGLYDVHAEVYENVTIGDYVYTLYDDENGTGSAYITKYKGNGTQIVLPEGPLKYNGVTYGIGIANSAFEGNTKLKKVAIPKGVEGISSKAFYGCTNLTEIAIGDDVVYIGDYVFANCPNLKTYRFGGDSVSDVNMINMCRLGQDDKDNAYTGITVYTKAGSPVEQYVKEINKSNGADNQIKIVYEADPYSNHTVVPDGTPAGGSSGSGSGGSGSSGSGGNDSGLGKDGTPLGKGASAANAKKALEKYAKETDPAGSVFNLLQLKISKLTKTSVKIAWKKVPGAKKYIIYGNACGKKNKMKQLATVTGKSKTFKKVLGKKVKKGTYYKFIVVALDSKNKVITTSKMVHGATPGGKVGNDKSVKTKAKSNKVSIKKGKTFKLAAKAVPKSKKLKVKRHRGIAYESTNKKIATITKKGVIKGVKKGSCYVYAYAQNGLCAKIKVTVK